MNEIIKLPVYKADQIEFEIAFKLTKDKQYSVILLETKHEGLSGIYKEVDYFYALSLLREELEKRNLFIGCKGALDHVFPSGLSAEMSDGLVAYDFSTNEKIHSKCRVNIFDSITEDEISRLVTFNQQKENRVNLIKNNRLGGRVQ